MSKLNVLLSMAAVAVVAFLVGYMVGASSVDEGADGVKIDVDKVKQLPTVAKGIEHCPYKGAEEAKVTIVEFTDYQ